LQLVTVYSARAFTELSCFITVALLWRYISPILGLETTLASDSTSLPSSASDSKKDSSSSSSTSSGSLIYITVILIVCILLIAVPLAADYEHSPTGSVKQTIRMFGKPKPVDTPAMLRNFIRARNVEQEDSGAPVVAEYHDNVLVVKPAPKATPAPAPRPTTSSTSKPAKDKDKDKAVISPETAHAIKELYANMRPGVKQRKPFPSSVPADHVNFLRPYPFSLAWLEQSKLEADTSLTPALAVVAKSGEFQMVRKQVGTFHFFERNRPILVFANGLTDDELHETALMLYTRLVRVQDDGSVSERERQKILEAAPHATPAAIDNLLAQVKARITRGTAQEAASNAAVNLALIAPHGMGLEKHICKIADAVKSAASSSKTVTMAPAALCSGDASCIAYDEYFKAFYRNDDFLNEQHYECSLQLRLRLPPPSLPLLPTTPSSTHALGRKPRVCVCTATYSSSDVGLAEQTILRQSFTSLPGSIRGDLDRYDFHVYIGSQVCHCLSAICLYANS
jgi:hypothetical protein